MTSGRSYTTVLSQRTQKNKEAPFTKNVLENLLWYLKNCLAISWGTGKWGFAAHNPLNPLTQLKRFCCGTFKLIYK